MTPGEVDRLRPSGELAAADWVRPRLRRFGSAVAAVVPDGFPAYARILHPASAADGRRARWAEVAAWSGRRVHPLAQFAAIARRADGTAWDGGEPATGTLPGDGFDRLRAVLARHSDTTGACWACLWEGYGWLTHDPDRPRVRLPGRDYLLFTGPLPAAADLFDGTIAHQTPNLLWPADRAWCVACEIDLHCTFVGGSEDLVDEILADRGLEAWPVRPGDPIAFDSDRINVA